MGEGGGEFQLSEFEDISKKARLFLLNEEIVF